MTAKIDKLPGYLLLWLLAALFLVLPASAADKAAAESEEELTAEKLASLDVKKPAFIYDSSGRPDPFRPFFDFTRLERAIPTDASKPLTPLEKYALNQFTLVGIILAGDGHNYALVEDPEHIGYTVREGDSIGNLSGSVREIIENTVIIEEPYLDIFDQRQVRTITLKLRATDFEEPTMSTEPQINR